MKKGKGSARKEKKRTERRKYMSKFRNRARYPSHAELFARPPNWPKSGAGIRRLRRSCVDPAVYLHNVPSKRRQSRDRHYCGPRARCSAMSSLPRICIQAYADKQHRRARVALECINPPGGPNRRDTPMSPDSRSIFAFTDVPVVCPLLSPAHIGGESQRGRERIAGMWRDAPARVHGDVSPDLTAFFETFTFISVFTRLCCEHGRYRRIFIVKSR